MPQNPMDAIGSPVKGFDLLGALKRNFRAIAVFGGALFLCLLPVAFLLSKSFYLSTGRIIIQRVVSPSISRSEQSPITNYFYDYAQTEVQRILNDTIVEAALTKLPRDAAKHFAPEGPNPDMVESLRSRLTVGLIPNTHLILVQIRAGDPLGLDSFVNALMRAYLDSAAKTEEDRHGRRLAFLLEERNHLKRLADNFASRLQSIAVQAGTSTFVEDNNLETRRLLGLQKAWTTAMAKHLATRNAYRATIEKVARLRGLSTQSLADELVANDESLWSISYWTYKTLQELRASIDGVNPGNPDRRYVEERMKAMQDYEANLKLRVSDRAARIVRDKRDYELSAELILTESDAQAAKETEEKIREQLDAAKEKASGNSLRIIQGQELTTALQHLRSQLFQLDTRIQEVRAESKAPLRVSIEQLAQPPGGPAGSNLKKLVLLFFMLAFGGVGGALLIVEFSDSRIRSSRDVGKAIGHPPSWPVSPWSGDGPFSHVTTLAPESQAAKALRSLAIRLNDERTRNGAKVATFTAVKGRSGTSDIAINTARSLKAFCPRVLLIDTDGSENGIRGRLDVPPQERELRECLGAGDSLETCVVHLPSEGIHLLCMGEGWQTEQNDALGKSLAELKERFDFICIDAAPVLQSDLTEYLLLQTDVAVLVVQGDRTEYAALRQGLEILVRLRVPSVATVLNWGGPRSHNPAERLISRLPEQIQRIVMPQLLSGRTIEKQAEES